MADGSGRSAMNGLEPGAATQRALRDAFGRFATGVTLVTTRGPSGPVGITANSFASVSLEPALLLWSPAKSSRRFGIFHAAEAFAVHVLGAHQMDLCRRFATVGDDWLDLDYEVNAAGVPLLPGCPARFECRTEARHDAGDHVLIVGRIERFLSGDGAPLVFSAGRYGGFAPA